MDLLISVVENDLIRELCPTGSFKVPPIAERMVACRLAYHVDGRKWQQCRLTGLICRTKFECYISLLP